MTKATVVPDEVVDPVDLAQYTLAVSSRALGRPVRPAVFDPADFQHRLDIGRLVAR